MIKKEKKEEKENRPLLSPPLLSPHTLSVLEEIIRKLQKEKKGMLANGQIKVPKGYNPDNPFDLLYCAEMTISQAYDKALDLAIQKVREMKMGKQINKTPIDSYK